MGLMIWRATAEGAQTNLRGTFTVLYALNMYFQSFGAVAIVKVNAHWFHVRERGGFSGIFGTMIASGIFLAFTVNDEILGLAAGAGPVTAAHTPWVFFVPSGLLLLMFLVELWLLRDRPGLAGHQDFDTGDASSGDREAVPVTEIMRRIVTNPIILTVAMIEFCTGVLRNGVMHWYPIYAKEVLALPGDHIMRSGPGVPWWFFAGPS
jgi:OPA family glycerol-3-phosphate transporter-like MFS transporter